MLKTRHAILIIFFRDRNISPVREGIVNQLAHQYACRKRYIVRHCVYAFHGICIAAALTLIVPNFVIVLLITFVSLHL